MYRIDTLEVREAYEASVSDEKRAATGRRMEAGAPGHRTERTLSSARRSGMTWDAVGYPGRGEAIPEINLIARNWRNRKRGGVWDYNVGIETR